MQPTPTHPTNQPREPSASRGVPPTTETYTPAVDVCDDGAEVRVTADVPGCRAEAIDVVFDDGILSIHAPVVPRSLPGRLLRQEYGVGDYRRSFRLGEGFDGAQITAALARGVLTVRVPRLAAVRPRRIEVRAD